METPSVEDRAYHVALAVHGYRSGEIAGTVETEVLTGEDCRQHLIRGDVDALLEALVEHGPGLCDGGHADLASWARGLAQGTAPSPVTEGLDLLDELGRLARIGWDESTG